MTITLSDDDIDFLRRSLLAMRDKWIMEAFRAREARDRNLAADCDKEAGKAIRFLGRLGFDADGNPDGNPFEEKEGA